MRSFQEIDAARHDAKLSRRTLYREAGVHHSTWQRLASGACSPTLRTLEKLDAALARLVDREKTA